MEDPRIISALFIFLKMAYYNVLINISSSLRRFLVYQFLLLCCLNDHCSSFPSHPVLSLPLCAAARKQIHISVSQSGRLFPVDSKAVSFSVHLAPP